MSPLVLAACLSALTADEAVELALKNSPLLRALEHRRAEEKARGADATHLQNPELRVQNFRSDRLFAPPGVRPEHPFGGVGVALRWEPPNPMVNAARRAESDEAVEGVEADLEAERREVTARVRSLHASALGLGQQIELARLTVEVRKQLTELTRKRVAEQAGRSFEQGQAELDQLEASAALLDLERDQRKAARELEIELAVEGPLEPAGPPLSCAPPSESLEALLAEAAAKSPSLAARQARIEAVDAQRTQAARERIPWFDHLQLGYVLATDNNPAYLSFRFAVSLPVLNWNQDRIELLAAARARLEEEQTAARRRLAKRVEQALADVRDDAQLVEQYRKAAPEAVEQSLAQLKRSLELGESSLTQIAQLRAKSISAQRAGLRAELHCQLAVIELQRLVGR